MAAESSPTDLRDLLEFLNRLGQAYLACGEQTAKVELHLRRIASAYGIRKSRVVAFPTALFILLHDGEDERITLIEGPAESLRLDQIADVYELGAAALNAAVPPVEGLQRLNAIRRKPPRFGTAGGVVGHIILAVGVSIVLMPSVTNVVAAALLGAIVGGLKMLNRDRPVLAVPLPVVAAVLVSSLVFLAMKQGLAIDPLHVLVPPLVSFLPGFMLTLAMVELAYGDTVSGSSRLTAGFVQLVLLAFGLAAGALLVGYRPEDLVDSTGASIAAAWPRWVGVIVFGIGAYLHFSAPRKSLRWMLLVLLLAFAAQQLTAGIFGANVSGFFGMLVATPLGYLIQLRFKGPPAMVTFLPTFWLLVPGALSLISVKHMLSDTAAGLDGLIAALLALVSLALGTLIGASLYKWLTETFGWWQLQIGRVGRQWQRRKKRP